MDQLYNFISTVGFKLMQEDKLAIYEAVGWIIASLPMEMAATTWEICCWHIYYHSVVQGTTPQHNQIIIGQLLL